MICEEYSFIILYFSIFETIPSTTSQVLKRSRSRLQSWSSTWLLWNLRQEICPQVSHYRLLWELLVAEEDLVEKLSLERTFANGWLCGYFEIDLFFAIFTLATQLMNSAPSCYYRFVYLLNTFFISGILRLGYLKTYLYVLSFVWNLSRW